MKTKEITGYAMRHIYENKESKRWSFTEGDNGLGHRARLILEIPERTVTISETEFDEAVKDIGYVEKLTTFKGLMTEPFKDKKVYEAHVAKIADIKEKLFEKAEGK
jgi:hypothetical protein